jgi:copper transport protein
MRLIVGLATLLLVVCSATDALAHAALVSVEPPDGSVLSDPPKRIELHFSESVTAGAVNLIDAQGGLRGDAKVDTTADSIVVTPPPALPPGTSIVSYRVISQDGHPVTGSVTFSVGAPSATTMPANADATINVLIWLARIGLYLGLFAGVGGVFFIAWIGRSPAGSGAVLGALVLGLIGAVASLGLEGLDVLGLPLSGLAAASPWKIALGTSLGPALLIAMAAMAASLLVLRRPSGGMSRILSGVALASVGLSLAATGHAATAPPRALTWPAMFIHGVGIAYWLGALLPLAATLWRQPKSSLPVVQRFSGIAIPVVGLLALAGIALAVVQVAHVDALIETRYGIILLIKLVLVASLLGVAALNRFRLTPALACEAKGVKGAKGANKGAEGPKSARPLARSVAVECALAVAILCVVAGWRFTPPPRTRVPDAPLAVHIHSDRAMLQVLISPAKVGADNFVLQLMNGDGSLLSAKEATLVLSMPDRGIEAMERPGVRGADGFWHVRDVALPVAGRWHMRIDALVTDFDKITLEDDFDVTMQ